MTTEKIRILLAEDNANLGSLLKEFLIGRNFDVTLCENGDVALDSFNKSVYDICVLDIIMPKMDGFTLVKEIKSINPDMPIVFLTAKNLQEDVLHGLKLGVDDYVCKPFSMEELILRIEAIMRRARGYKEEATQDLFNIKGIVFDCKKQTLSNGKIEVKLTTKETELLRLLCINANKILERKFALKYIWDDNNYFNARSMDVYITKLRKHLKMEEGVEILNVHGKGYKLVM